MPAAAVERVSELRGKRSKRLVPRSTVIRSLVLNFYSVKVQPILQMSIAQHLNASGLASFLTFFMVEL